MSERAPAGSGETGLGPAAVGAAAFLALPQPAAVVTGSGTLVTANDAFHALLAASVGCDVTRFCHPADRDAFLRRVAAAAADPTAEPVSVEHRYLDRHGCEGFAVCRVGPLPDLPGGLVAITLADVSGERRDQATYAQQTAVLEEIASGAPLEVVLAALCRSIEAVADGARCTILLLNEDGCTVRHGAAPSMPREFCDAVDGAAIGPAAGSCGTAMYTGHDVIVEDIATHPYWREWRDLALPFGLRACWSTPVVSSPRLRRRVLGSFAVYYDVPRGPSVEHEGLVRRAGRLAAIAIERDLLAESLRRASDSDPLTGLANRRAFSRRLAEALDRAPRDVSTVAVLYLDLDRFKLVNDSMGHEAGDELLVQVAGRLTHALRPHDTVARLGGDEFTVVCESVWGPAEADLLADRVRLALAAPFSVFGRTLHVTASVGLALGRAGTAPGVLLGNADAAMYRAKEAGRACVARFDDALLVAARRRFSLESALRDALVDGGLRLAYQPVVDLTTRRVMGVEALARWSTPELGEVPPTEFVALAEDAGMITRLGQWVVAEACRQREAWRRAGIALRLSVNVSARELADPGYADRLVGLLEATGTPPDAVVVEVTESALADARTVTAAMDRLRELGVGLSVDDFGTGQSSLARLRALRPAELKVDRSFVRALGTDGEASTIVRAVVAMAESLGMSVVAEGVETEEQLQAVTELGCRYGQGFLLGAPAGPAELALPTAGGWGRPRR